MTWNIHRTRRVSGWIALCLGIIFIALIGYGFTQTGNQGLHARLLPAHMRGQVVWKTFTAEQVHRGVSVPADTNIIFHLPEDSGRITRRTLFGRRGKDVRYWGYCFPDDYSEEKLAIKSGFPGKIFLSEMEQTKIQIKIQEERRQRFSTPRNLTEDDLNEANSIRGLIRHQKEVFLGGETCYLMTEKVLPLGTDIDNDSANSKVEAAAGSYPYIADSDEDGIVDGLEIFGLGTDPMIRDTDGDGLIDGKEDKNHNGRIDKGETIPTEWDSDRDGLCDGYCKVGYNVRTGYSAPVGYVHNLVSDKIYWEDKNLNGEVDTGETDPLKADTDGDGILDDQEFYNCFLSSDDVDCGI